MCIFACVCLSPPGQEEVTSPSPNPACDALPLSRDPPRLLHQQLAAPQRERAPEPLLSLEAAAKSADVLFISILFPAYTQGCMCMCVDVHRHTRVHACAPVRILIAVHCLTSDEVPAVANQPGLRSNSLLAIKKKKKEIQFLFHAEIFEMPVRRGKAAFSDSSNSALCSSAHRPPFPPPKHTLNSLIHKHATGLFFFYFSSSKSFPLGEMLRH